MKIVAIIAHYNVEGGLSNNFLEILSVFCENCHHVILVSTSYINELDLIGHDNLSVINRPNVGYDFYSYKVGFNALSKIKDIDKLFIANSSFTLLDSRKFDNALKKMLSQSPNTVVGLTLSNQIAPHLQSYLLLIGKNIVYSDWFVKFINSIQPENTKFNIIAKYEIGLSAEFIRRRVTLKPIFEGSNSEKIRSSFSYSKFLIKKIGFVRFLIGPPSKYMREVNWSHYGARSIAMRYGIVKSEVTRGNPFGINLDFIKAFNYKLHRKSPINYSYGSDGLARLNHKEILISKVSYGRSRGIGVNVAVVLHLYYVELLPEIVSTLRDNLIDPFDIFITTPFEGEIPKILDSFAHIAASTNVFLTQNIGRDIAPFLEIYKTGVLDNYSCVLKIHSKKSLYSANGDYWRKDIYRQLIGGTYLTRKIINLLQQGVIGIVGASKYYLSDDRFWGADKTNTSKLLRALGVLSPIEEPKLGFFAGSMFWFHPKALLPMKNLQVEFEPENGAQDGTMAHAIERMFCQISRHCGFLVVSPDIEDRDLDKVDLGINHVPVL